MTTPLWIILGVFVYAFGFVMAAVLEKRFLHHNTSPYEPMETPLPTLWPICLAFLVIASPFYLLHATAVYFTRDVSK